jgi:hypothetical protein
MMDVVGYCIINRNAKTGMGMEIESFLNNEPVRVIEFATDGGVLVINRSATGIATFDKEDIVASFKCTVCNDVICPPNYDILKQMEYATVATMRKGGYGPIVKRMVIAASLHRREFCDSILWAKQNHPEYGSND